MEEKSNRLYAEMPPVKLFFHAAIPGVISMFAMSIYNIIEGIFIGQFVGGDAFTLSTAIVFPLIMVAVLWPLGLDGLWLNQAATYIPVGIIAFIMLRRTQKSLAPHLR